MHDLQGRDVSYKLLGPALPQLTTEGIKRGTNESYLFLKSTKPAELDTKIESFRFIIDGRPNITVAPNFIRSKIDKIVIYPDEKDIYFDDSLLQKISDEELETIINGL